MSRLHLPQTFAITWKPTAKGRPRTTVRGGHAIIYTPKSTRDAEAGVAASLMEQRVHFYPRGVPVTMHAMFGVARPNDGPRREHYPPRRPDLANYLMLLADAGTGVLWEDDSQLVVIEASKQIVLHPVIRLTVGVPMEDAVVPPWARMGWERIVFAMEEHFTNTLPLTTIGKPTVGKMLAYRKAGGRE